MAENKMSTSVAEVSFDSIIAEFDKPEQSTKTDPFVPQEGKTNPVFDGPVKKEEEKKVEEKKVEDPVVTKKEKVEIKDLDSVLDRTEEEEEVKKAEPGSLSTVLQDLTNDGILFPFDEDKPLSEYSSEDIKELLKANIDHQKKEVLESEISEFFESLPVEIQYAAKYVADGGTDLKSLFKALAATEEIKSLDIKNVKDRESIIREYYRAIEWGTEDEIKEEVERIKEIGESELEKLANKFKPKLEKMHDEVTQQQIQRQDRAKQLQQQEMEVYLENAHEAIKAGKIDGVQLDKKTQASLWAGLTQPSYQTRRGTATNELGHLLEKYQYTEPNFELMYEVLWLLRDREGFKDAVGKKVKNEVVSDTARVLKTEQGKKSHPTSTETKEDAKREKKVIQRNLPNFMSGLRNK